MKKEEFQKALRSLNNRIFELKIIQDIVSSFKELKRFFIDNSIDNYKQDIIKSFKKNRGTLSIITNEGGNLYPDYVTKMKANAKKIVDYGDDFSSLNNSDFLEIAKFNCLSTLFSCTVSTELVFSIDEYNAYKKVFSGSEYYYRGQCDSSYELIPSFYRKLKTSQKNIDNDFVLEKYKVYGFYQRYITLFNDEKDKDLDYEMMSYIQHSAAYSPLLDVTSSLDIAMIFACSGIATNPNEYDEKDASFYIFKMKEIDYTKDEKLNIHWLSEKLKFDTEIKPGRPLFVCSASDFAAKYTLKTEYTNDRMKYQKGAFLLFSDGYIVNGHFLIPYHQMYIIKVIVPKEIKKALYQKLVKKNKFYTTSYLMEPYSFISDFLSNP